jgi:hypothetical protein
MLKKFIGYLKKTLKIHFDIDTKYYEEKYFL